MATKILEMIVCSAMFMLLYYLLISRKAKYGFCRRYLILTVMVSTIIPLMDIPVFFINDSHIIETDASYVPMSVEQHPVAQPQENAPQYNEQVPAVWTVAIPASDILESPVPDIADESVIQSESVQTVNVARLPVYLLLGYLCVALFLLLWVVKGVVSILRLRKKSDLTDYGDFCLAESEDVQSPFSFLDTIYLDARCSGAERSHILSHEVSHIRHRHSYEKLFMSVLRSFLWFNPFVWLAEKSLDEVQEWQADSDALSVGYNLDDYRRTIIMQLFGMNPMPASGLNNSFTKRRLEKMTQKIFWKRGILPFGYTILECAILFVCFGCRPSGFLSVIFTADTFYDDGLKHPATRLDDGYYCFEDPSSTYCQYPAVIAATNVMTAKSPNSYKLKWVDENTRIIIGNKKSTMTEFKKLQKSDYSKIVYQRSGKYSFVYAETESSFVNYIRNIPVMIDFSDNLKLPDFNEITSELVGEDIFIADNSFAMPEASFAVDGKFVSYEMFKKMLSHEKGRIFVYRNEEARKRFGDNVWEVVELQIEGNRSVSDLRNEDMNEYSAYLSALEKLEISTGMKGNKEYCYLTNYSDFDLSGIPLDFEYEIKFSKESDNNHNIVSVKFSDKCSQMPFILGPYSISEIKEVLKVQKICSDVEDIRFINGPVPLCEDDFFKTLDLLQRPHSKKVADMQNSASDSKKLKKPRFVESLNDTLLFDIVATDTYDSLYFSLTLNEDDNVTINILAQTVQGEYKMDSDYYIGLYNEKYVAKRKGYENSDTLYGVRVTGLRNNNEIMVSNEGTTLKFFGKDYGQSVSVYDLNGELVAKRGIRNGMTELPIPMARGYLKEVLIDIKYDEYRNYSFKYPIR